MTPRPPRSATALHPPRGTASGTSSADRAAAVSAPTTAARRANGACATPRSRPPRPPVPDPPGPLERCPTPQAILAPVSERDDRDPEHLSGLRVYERISD